MPAAGNTDGWTSAGTDEPFDQQRDLTMPGHFAIIGPEYPDGYGWTVVRISDSADIDSGIALDETAAIAAAEEWERVNRP